jgi:hypothetical protein
VEFTTHTHLLQWLRISGATPYSAHRSSSMTLPPVFMVRTGTTWTLPSFHLTPTVRRVSTGSLLHNALKLLPAGCHFCMKSSALAVRFPSEQQVFLWVSQIINTVPRRKFFGTSEKLSWCDCYKHDNNLQTSENVSSNRIHSRQRPRRRHVLRKN